MDNATVKEATIGARITKSLDNRLNRAADRKRDPFAPSVSQIIIRGIELALQELEKRHKE